MARIGLADAQERHGRRPRRGVAASSTSSASRRSSGRRSRSAAPAAGSRTTVEEFERDRRAPGSRPARSHQVLIEESVLGWKEYELEVMRDLADNVVVICSIENFDAMGVHTGDSITVAPAQTLTDKEYQAMRDAAIRVIREVGVETGGSNIQFAVDPADGRMVRDRDEPARVALVGAGLEGHRLSDRQDRGQAGRRLHARRDPERHHAQSTPSSFEPTLDYVVVKIPRWAFEKFPRHRPTLGTQMKSVGEAMAIGRTFKEALQKAIRSLEIGRSGLGRRRQGLRLDPTRLREKLITPELGARSSTSTTRSQAGMSGVDRRRADRDRSVVPSPRSRSSSSSKATHRPPFDARRPCPTDLLRRRQALRILRPPARPTCSARTRTRCARAGRRSASGRSTSASTPARPSSRPNTPYLYSTYEDEDEAQSDPPAQGHDPGRRAEPHRAGDRVRLLLLPRLVRAPRGGDRDHHGQLQPRDGLDRLRHLGPALLRAADARGRAAHRRDREARRA